MYIISLFFEFVAKLCFESEELDGVDNSSLDCDLDISGLENLGRELDRSLIEKDFGISFLEFDLEMLGLEFDLERLENFNNSGCDFLLLIRDKRKKSMTRFLVLTIHYIQYVYFFLYLPLALPLE